ncbi:hypothetical protein A2U01_0114238, partial [Trifolium medium]|nr:hypothetical protein [Trifolium medium]
GAINPLGFAMPPSIRPLWGGWRKTSAFRFVLLCHTGEHTEFPTPFDFMLLGSPTQG